MAEVDAPALGVVEDREFQELGVVPGRLCRVTPVQGESVRPAEVDVLDAPFGEAGEQRGQRPDEALSQQLIARFDQGASLGDGATK